MTAKTTPAKLLIVRALSPASPNLADLHSIAHNAKDSLNTSLAEVFLCRNKLCGAFQMAYETIIFEPVDDVAVITLNRPDALNALNVKLSVSYTHLTLPTKA